MYQVFSNDCGDDIAIYVPGYSKADLKVHRSQDYIIVEGATESQYAMEPSVYYKFKLTSPVKVDPEFNNGVLVLHLKRFESKTHQINIR